MIFAAVVNGTVLLFVGVSRHVRRNHPHVERQAVAISRVGRRAVNAALGEEQELTGLHRNGSDLLVFLVKLQRELSVVESLFAAESIHKFALQCKQLKSELEELKTLETQTLPESEMESLNANLANLREQIRSCDAVVDYFVHSYLDSIAKSHEFSEDAIARQFKLIFQSPHLAEKYKLKLENQLDVIKKHITLYYNHPDEINFTIIKEDIVSY